jgi:hypothetical protein
MKKFEEKGFYCTDPDTNQWVKKISNTRFLVYEKAVLFDIDINDYSKEELEEKISAYYNSLEEVLELYGEDSNEILAECIAESDIST